jgi:hypothetical protein
MPKIRSGDYLNLISDQVVTKVKIIHLI